MSNMKSYKLDELVADGTIKSYNYQTVYNKCGSTCEGLIIEFLNGRKLQIEGYSKDDGCLVTLIFN